MLPDRMELLRKNLAGKTGLSRGQRLLLEELTEISKALDDMKYEKRVMNLKEGLEKTAEGYRMSGPLPGSGCPCCS